MAFSGPLEPIDLDDDVLAEYLREADVPALLLTLVQLTGDLSLLPSGTAGRGWLHQEQGGLSPDRQDAVRARALRVLRDLRDRRFRAPPSAPDPDLLHTASSWVMGRDTTDLMPLLREQVQPPGSDTGAPDWKLDETAARDFRVVIVGAGPSGLLAAHRLSQAGVPFVVYEKNAEVGGTWLENTYPGCRVDVPSHLYTFACATRTDWPEHFCTQEELLGYFRTFATEFGLYEHIRFRSEVTSAQWDEQRREWSLEVTTDQGPVRDRARAVISAVGQLNRPRLPDIPGRDTFTGPAFHSARWDASVDLAGRRVAVIGTGASAFQFVPEIAEAARHLLVFQRTPPWMRPSPDYGKPLSEGALWLFRHVPHYAMWYRFVLAAPGLQGAPWVVDPRYPVSERAVSAENERVRAVLVAAMEAQLSDAPELLPRVIPGYPVGSKRVVRDNGRWFATLKRDDVTLVTEPVTEIDAGGLRTADGARYAADVIVYGTGFQADRFLEPMSVTGRGGADLHKSWNGDARAYLGTTVPGFPNFFCLYGPNTNLVGQGNSILFFSECAVTYVMDALRRLTGPGRPCMEVRQDVHDRYNAWIDEATRERAWGWTSVRTWYVNEHGRSPQNWPFSALEYWQRTRAVDPGDYLME
ncbi:MULTISPECIES: flavin-containing monooxygenase [Streptomyces]|uniref:4-hydroxyacetophenone monooxygenase n=1 Tax=Streptomyces chartreusis NRRL 3882 TaxID=1079985 RepID=A0A2N9B390_STRCX|nr:MULTISPECIES: NAD(P)/FAD-dependent oxidoreductase [Streptomyces]MYS89701.1 NAD(P)-binding domain-containing protein [Streptomyces sp. SID5464]SOR77826.1 4-hydroxyacetophenone monooxygenase [Streptomyces chartreusis NRRL 3882]